MPTVDGDAVEIRVVGCLLEKQRATPDAYPLSLNALRLACNQSTNRDPVVDYDEATVVEALRRTALKGWTRLASGAGSRARKYRHLMDEAFDADDAELSLLAVLMLRGIQTPGELKQRTDRLHGFADLAAVHETLERAGRARLRRTAAAPPRSEGGALPAASGRGRGGDPGHSHQPRIASIGSSGNWPNWERRCRSCAKRSVSLRRRGSRSPASARGGSRA